MRLRWVMLVAASVTVAAACSATPGLGTDEEPEVIPHSQSAPTSQAEASG